MSLTKEDLQAIAALTRGIVKDELVPVRAEMQEGLTQVRAEMQEGFTRIVEDEIVPLRAEMQEGFTRMENLINVAAKDAARTERLLRKHIEQPVH
jgi:hypothetical protein